MSDRESIRWTWLCKVAAALILVYAISVGVLNSAGETSANIAQHAGTP